MVGANQEPSRGLLVDENASRMRREEIACGRRDVVVRALNAVSPLATLERGYAIVTRAADGTLIRDAAQLTQGERIRARLGRGEIDASVEDIRKGKE